MTYIGLFTILSKQDRYFQVSFRELVNISAVGKGKLFSLFKSYLIITTISSREGNMGLLRNHPLTLSFGERKGALIPRFLQMPRAPMADPLTNALFRGWLEKERRWHTEWRNTDKAAVVGGKVEEGLTFIYLSFAVDGTECARVDLWPETWAEISSGFPSRPSTG